MKSTRLSFLNTQGQKLSAILDLPKAHAPRAYAIFAHCFTCGKLLRPMYHICKALTHEGIAVLRFDFTGIGESEGHFADTNFSTNVSDLLQAAAYLKEHYAAPKLLIGHSLGGTAAVMAATHLKSIRAVATIGTPSEPAHVVHHFTEYRRDIEDCGEAVVPVDGRPFTISRQFIENVESVKLKNVIHKLKAAILICHSPVDKTVNIRNAQELFQTAPHPKSFISLDSADHLLMDETDARYTGQMIAAWASRYLQGKV